MIYEAAVLTRQKVNIYPYPDNFDLEFNSEYLGEIQIIIYNNHGDLVFKKSDLKTLTFFKRNIELNIPPGNYLIDIFFGENKLSKLFLI